MAELPSVATATVAAVSLALQSSAALSQTILSVQSRQKVLRELRDELQDLVEVLQLLQESIGNLEIDITALEQPLIRCRNACEEFNTLIKRDIRHSTEERGGIIDWLNLRYMGEGIPAFKTMLAGYRSIFVVVLACGNLRKMKPTRSVLEKYKDLIENTKHDLETHSHEIRTRFQATFAENIVFSRVEASEIQSLEDEKNSTQKGLEICEHFLSLINQSRASALEEVGHSSRPFNYTSSSVAPDLSWATNAEGLNAAPKIVISWKIQLLQQQCLRIFQKMMTYFESSSNENAPLLEQTSKNRAKDNGQGCSDAYLLTCQALDESSNELKGIESRLQSRLETLVLANDLSDVNERSRLVGDINTSRQCLEICKVALEISSRSTDWNADGHGFLVTKMETLENLLKGKNRDSSLLAPPSKTPLSEPPETPYLNDFDDDIGAKFKKSHGETIPTLAESSYDTSLPRTTQELNPQVLINGQPEGVYDGSGKDSGYASASLSTELMVSSDSASQAVIQLPSPCELADSIQTDNYEVQSHPSQDDEIGSQRSFQTTREEMTGKALIRLFLAEEPRFRILCEKAVEQMDQVRFTNNLRRLLKSFHKNISAEAEAESEKIVADLLRSRRGRLRIGQDLRFHILEEKQENCVPSKVDLHVPSRDQNLVEGWLARIVDRPMDSEELETPEVDIEPSPNNSDDIQVEQFPNIADVKKFLREARSFQVLLKDFMLMFLPVELKDVLLSVPRKQIRVSVDQDVSFVNRAKLWIEHKSQVRWIWWPLERGKRMLRDSESRVLWECSCGAKQWEEVSTEQGELVIKILTLMDDGPQLPDRCMTKMPRVFFPKAFRPIFWKDPAAAAPQTSTASRKYVPRELSQVISTRNTKIPGPGNRQSSNTALPHQRDSITNQTVQIALPNTTIQNQAWILFGVQGARRTLNPTQIVINDQSTDYNVFKELKKFYRLHRGRLRLWFSIWRLENCEVVKFHRMTFNRMIRDHRDLPDRQDYMYKPRAGTRGAKNPPISPHIFQTLFYACHFPCRWFIPHDCMQPPAGDYHIDRIPKRTRCFEKDQTSPIWGLETIFAVSFAYVFVYHCLMMIGPFIFFWFWTEAHPADLQNASVPAVIVLGALSLFWSGAGILTNTPKYAG